MSDIEEALGGRLGKRGAARPQATIALKRLPDGSFAPKGMGTVLQKGQVVTVPHAAGGEATGRVKEIDRGQAVVSIHKGPNEGESVRVNPGTSYRDRWRKLVGQQTPDGQHTIQDADEIGKQARGLKAGQSMKIPLPEGEVIITRAKRNEPGAPYHVMGGGANADPEMRRGHRKLSGSDVGIEAAERIKHTRHADQVHTAEHALRVRKAKDGEKVQITSTQGDVGTVHKKGDKYVVTYGDLPPTEHAHAVAAVGHLKKDMRESGNAGFLPQGHDVDPLHEKDTRRARAKLDYKNAVDRAKEGAEKANPDSALAYSDVYTDKAAEVMGKIPLVAHPMNATAEHETTGEIVKHVARGAKDAAAPHAEHGLRMVGKAAEKGGEHGGAAKHLTDSITNSDHAHTVSADVASAILHHGHNVVDHAMAAAPHVATHPILHHLLSLMQARAIEVRAAERAGDRHLVIEARRRAWDARHALEEAIEAAEASVPVAAMRAGRQAAAELREAARGGDRTNTSPQAPDPRVRKASDAPPTQKGVRDEQGPATTEGQMVSAGERVMHLQRRLDSLGHEVLDDGKFGPKTAEAVKAFQRSAMLKDDGIVGPLTTTALKAAPSGGDMHTANEEPDQPHGEKEGFQRASDANGDGVPEPAQPGGSDVNDLVDTSETQDVPDAGDPRGSSARSKKGGSPSALYKGAGVGSTRGDRSVRQVQVALASAGHSVKVDGRFGPVTEKHVKRFQRHQGLKPDGVVGAKTQRVLKAASKKLREAETRADTPDLASGPPMGMAPKAPKGAGTWSANKKNASLKDLPLGTQFKVGEATYTLHAPGKDPFYIAKPVGGGKAVPVHKLMAPAKVGPVTEGYDPAGKPVRPHAADSGPAAQPGDRPAGQDDPRREGEQQGPNAPDDAADGKPVRAVIMHLPKT